MKQCCEFQGKVQFQNTLLVLESLSEKQGVAVSHLGDTDTGKNHFGELVQHMNTGVGKHHFGILSLAY
jgi:hypothetical protein